MKKRFIFEQKCKTTTSSSNILRQSLKGVDSILDIINTARIPLQFST